VFRPTPFSEIYTTALRSFDSPLSKLFLFDFEARKGDSNVLMDELRRLYRTASTTEGGLALKPDGSGVTFNGNDLPTDKTELIITGTILRIHISESSGDFYLHIYTKNKEHSSLTEDTECSFSIKLTEDTHSILPPNIKIGSPTDWDFSKEHAAKIFERYLHSNDQNELHLLTLYSFSALLEHTYSFKNHTDFSKLWNKIKKYIPDEEYALELGNAILVYAVEDNLNNTFGTKKDCNALAELYRQILEESHGSESMSDTLISVIHFLDEKRNQNNIEVYRQRIPCGFSLLLPLFFTPNDVTEELKEAFRSSSILSQFYTLTFREYFADDSTLRTRVGLVENFRDEVLRCHTFLTLDKAIESRKRLNESGIMTSPECFHVLNDALINYSFSSQPIKRISRESKPDLLEEFANGFNLKLLNQFDFHCALVSPSIKPLPYQYEDAKTGRTIIFYLNVYPELLEENSWALPLYLALPRVKETDWERNSIDYQKRESMLQNSLGGFFENLPDKFIETAAKRFINALNREFKLSDQQNALLKEYRKLGENRNQIDRFEVTVSGCIDKLINDMFPGQFAMRSCNQRNQFPRDQDVRNASELIDLMRTEDAGIDLIRNIFRRMVLPGIEA
jgi:hypothetical protein